MMLWLSDPRGDPPIFELDIVLLRPRARGTVRLRSRDPAKPPLIQLPDRCDPIDIERLAEGYLRGLDVATHPGIRSLCSAPPSPSARQSASSSGTSSVLTRTTSRTSSAPARWACGRRWRGRRRLGSSARHGRRQRGRCLDRSQRSIGVHAPPDGHARRASRRAACRSPLTKSAVRCGGHRGENARADVSGASAADDKRQPDRNRPPSRLPLPDKPGHAGPSVPGPESRHSPQGGRERPASRAVRAYARRSSWPQVGERHLRVSRWSSARPCLGGDRLPDGQPRRAPRRGFCPD